MQVEVKDLKGAAVKKIDLPESIYGLEMNEHVLHTVVKAYQANRRQGTHATLTRSLVSGGGRKPFKQKGTGNARQGTSRAPNMPGGAVVHGPQPRQYNQKVNRKTKVLALKVALSDKLRNKKLIVLSDFEISEYNTKHICAALKTLGATSALLADERKDNFLYKSAGNIHKVSAVTTGEMNAENILRYENLIISENAINALQQRLGAN